MKATYKAVKSGLGIPKKDKSKKQPNSPRAVIGEDDDEKVVTKQSSPRASRITEHDDTDEPRGKQFTRQKTSKSPLTNQLRSNESLEEKSSSSKPSGNSYKPNKFRLQLSDICVADIIDSGTEFDAQDPMVQITIGKGIQRTERYFQFPIVVTTN